MSEYIHIGTLRIRRRTVAIISVLIALTLMTTISYNAAFVAYAAGEEGQTQQEQPQADQPKTEGEMVQQAQQQGAQTETPAGQQGTDASQGGAGTAQQSTDAAKTAEGAPAEGSQAGQTPAADPNAPAAGTDAAQPDAAADPAQEAEAVANSIVNRKPTMPAVSSSSYFVMSGSTSEPVIQHHAERKMSPGKITMLVTAMVAIDNMYNEDELQNTYDVTDKLMEYGNSFNAGESITVGSLLDAMLVGGSEQAAEALARYSASKRKIFIRMMNSKAMELGLMDTQFSNPTGRYSTSQYSTAKDCAVITQAAIRYPLIRQALEKKTVEFAATTKASERVVGFRSTNPLLLNDDGSLLYPQTKGGIMGTVGKPVKGSQYAGVATIDDMQLIVVLMDSGADKVAYEARSLFEYANTIVTRNTIVKEGKRVGIARIRGGMLTTVFAYTATKGFAYVPPEGSESLIETRVVMDDDLEAPMKAGDRVGEYRIYVADELKGTVDLVIKQDVPKGWPPSQIYISNMATVIICLILLLLLLLGLRILYVKRRRKKLRQARRERRLQEIARQQFEMDEDRRRRNWTYNTSSYDREGLRTTDLRREALEAELEEERKNQPKREKKKVIRAERKASAKKESGKAK